MNITFLSPWMWAGVLAIAGPLWLHLRRKQEKNVVRFSAVQFLHDQPEPRRSPFRLRDLILLALRVLAVALAAAAFAWPYRKDSDAIAVKESRVYVLDNTLSHQAQDGFENDRKRILSEVAKAGPGVQIAVIELASQPRVVAAFGEPRQAIEDKVRALAPSFERGSYLAGFRMAQSLLNNSLGERKRIVFCGDNQENQWSEQSTTPPFLRNVEVDVGKTETAERANLALAEPRIQRIFSSEKSFVNFTVKLIHLGAARSAKVALRANEQVIFEREADLEGQPETVLLQAQWEVDPSLWLRGDVSVEGQPDALAGDNRLFFSLAPLVEGRVALLAQSPYLRVALSPAVMRGQWAARELDPTQLAAELTADADAEVLCIESSYLQSADARKLVWRYQTNGRGVVLFMDRVTPVISGYLRDLGFETGEWVTPARNRVEKIQFVTTSHPIFHPFLSPEYGNLSEIRISKYARLKSSEAVPLMFSDAGAPLFFQSTRTHGKVFVLGFSMDREHSSWPVHPSFIPFLDLVLQAARAEDPIPTNFEPGEIARIPLARGARAREVVLRDDKRVLARAGVEGGVAQVRVPRVPGIYEITYDDDLAVRSAFSVNPSPKESELRYAAAPEALSAWQVQGQQGPAISGSKPARVPATLAAALEQRWWWWLLAGAAAAMVLETVLAGIKREAT